MSILRFLFLILLIAIVTCTPIDPISVSHSPRNAPTPSKFPTIHQLNAYTALMKALNVFVHKHTRPKYDDIRVSPGGSLALAHALGDDLPSNRVSTRTDLDLFFIFPGSDGMTSEELLQHKWQIEFRISFADKKNFKRAQNLRGDDPFYCEGYYWCLYYVGGGGGPEDIVLVDLSAFNVPEEVGLHRSTEEFKTISTLPDNFDAAKDETFFPKPSSYLARMSAIPFLPHSGAEPKHLNDMILLARHVLKIGGKFSSKEREIFQTKTFKDGVTKSLEDSAGERKRDLKLLLGLLEQMKERK